MAFLHSGYFLAAVIAVATLALAMVGYGLLRRNATGSNGAQGQRNLKSAKAKRHSDAMEKGRAYLAKGKLEDAFAQFGKLKVDDEVAALLEQIALEYQAVGDGKQAEKVHAFIARQNKAYRKFSKQMPGANTVMMMDEPAPAPEPLQPKGGAWANLPPGTPSVDAPTVQMRAMPELLQATAPPADKPKKGGKISALGPYKLKRLVAETSTGMTYIGVDERSGAEALIKAFPVQGARGSEKQQALMEFAESARSLAALNHPNIARLLRAGQAEGVAFVAMEPPIGEDVGVHCVAGNLLKPAEVTSMAVRLADALHQAHERNLVHGDIKPAAVVYDAGTGSVKLMDFGLSRIATQVETAAGVIHGTPSYMSPEQISGRKVDARSDLFSLAVTTYQLLSGRLPFEGENFNDLMYRLVSINHPDIRTLNKELPADVVAFFDRALAKNPKQRFQTGHEFAKALREAMAWAG